MSDINEISLGDKDFTRFINRSQIETMVSLMSGTIGDLLCEDENDIIFMPVLNGATFFATDLISHISLPLRERIDLVPVQYKSYEGTKSGELNAVIGVPESVFKKTVVVIEDIVDTGKTIARIIDDLSLNRASRIIVATLCTKTKTLKKVDKFCYGFDFSEDHPFIVGYGLDYDSKGRCLPEIYKLKD